MTTLLRCLILFLVSLSVEAAAPTISCTPSRTTGTAPLGVILDCSNTTDSDTTKPFHDLYYTHTFGDLNAGAWTNGANTALSKNFATGPIAAHVYETAGTYTITSTVSDGTTLARVTNTITVANPDTTFTGAATVCFFNSAVGTGCPAGATETASSDFDAAILSCFGTTKRCLFKRGDTFVSGTSRTLAAAGPSTIGAYGSGALPIVSISAAVNAIILSVTTTDIRIMDLEFVGQDAAGSDKAFTLNADGDIDRVTILRVTSRLSNGGMELGVGASPVYGLTNSVLQENTIYDNRGAQVFLRCPTRCAVLGNSVGPVNATGGAHALRIQRWQRSVVSHNTLQGPAATNEVVALRADTFSTTVQDSFYNVFSDNKVLLGANASISIQIRPSNGSTDARVYDLIAERNWLLGDTYTGATTCFGFSISAVRVTVRNNLVDLSAATTCARNLTNIQLLGIEPAPDDNQILNNTFYDTTTGHTVRAVLIQAGATNTVVKNNLAWFDLGTGFLSDAGTGTVASNNSTDPETLGTDPAFDTPLTSPIGFRIGTGSYAATAGTALFPSSNDDFFHCDDTTANERLGAFVPRVRATCRGSAGP